jgi:hypothetical protein
VTSYSGQFRSRARAALKHQLQHTPECIDVHRFGETLTAEEHAHLETCTRCQAELALWQEFAEPTPLPDETEIVQSLVADLRRAPAIPQSLASTARLPRRFGRVRLSVLAAAASLLLAAAAGYVAWNPEPRIEAPEPARDADRSAAVQVLGPTGDLAVAPKELAWAALEAAARYDVEIFEVDGTVLWRVSLSSPRVELPPEVVDRFVPGKTLVWKVTARNAAGAAIAHSGAQRVRVALVPPTKRE